MADTESKRSRPSAQPKRRRLNRTLKNRQYETVYDLNRGFNLILEIFERIERQAFFRRDYIRAFHTMADELRARANYELTETLRDHEGKDSAQFGRLRLKWERRFQNSHRTKVKRSKIKTPKQ